MALLLAQSLMCLMGQVWPCFSSLELTLNPRPYTQASKPYLLMEYKSAALEKKSNS